MISELLSSDFDSNKLLLRFLVYLIILFIAFPIHEFAHAFMAYKLGDRTPEYQGRLTLNPLAHIDFLGALLMILVGYGWGKPVETNPNNYTRKVTMRGGMALVSFAGPLSNILMGLVGLIAYKLIPADQIYLLYAIGIFINTNVFLAAFNLIPIPPLDGSKILMVLLSPRAYDKYLSFERYYVIILLVLIMSNVLSYLIGIISNGIYWVLDMLTFFL